MELDLSIILPTYNEAEIIESAIKTIASELGSDLCARSELIIVDDGSDALIDIVHGLGRRQGFFSVTAVRNSPPIGKGRSLGRGFEFATGKVVGFLDVDLSTSPRYIHEALEAIGSGKTDIFIASRRAAGARVTREQFFLKSILGDAFRGLARAVFFAGMPAYEDTQCGFKFFRQPLAKILYRDLSAGDGLADVEVLLRANLLGYKVLERGVEWMDIRESKRSLRRILVGEVVSLGKIFVRYRLFLARERARLREVSQKS